MVVCMRWALWLWLCLCLGCHKPGPPEALVLPPELPPLSRPSEGPDIDKVDVLTLIPHLWAGSSPYARVPTRDLVPLALRVHREVLAMEEALPAERAPLDDLVLRFYLHMLAFDLSNTEELGMPPFYGCILDQSFSTHLLRAAQLLRLEPELEQAPLAIRYAEYLARGLLLADRRGPFMDENLMLEMLRYPPPILFHPDWAHLAP